VKNLAIQSKQAVAQIRNILNEIRNAGQTAVEAAAQGRVAVEAGRQQSLQSGEAIQKLAASAAEAARSAVQISASSRQQLTGMEQISQAIVNINDAGNESLAGNRQVEEQIRTLQGLAVVLGGLLDAKATA
jgi:methyl-accepting chemotaxis protein